MRCIDKNKQDQVTEKTLILDGQVQMTQRRIPLLFLQLEENNQTEDIHSQCSSAQCSGNDYSQAQISI